MTTIQGKIWGMTQPLFNLNNVEIHRVEILKGGYCSKHLHRHKQNMFYVESGTLLIEQWKNDYELCDKTVLQKGQSCIVPVGEQHRFEALTDVVAYEIYWVTLDTRDIEREDVGGIREEG